MTLLHFQAVIRPQKAEHICRLLINKQVVSELCAQEILGGGRRVEPKVGFPEGVAKTVLLPKVILTGVIADGDRDAVTDIIMRWGRSGRSGDGKIFYTRINEA